MNQISELKDADVDLDSMVSENLREILFERTVDDIFPSGTGEFGDEEYVKKSHQILTSTIRSKMGCSRACKK